ncbi:MAG: M23 family metallopeptidase [Candidatus Methylomirabilis sp.]|nr:M23 family metallopeptidase [Deltaproteobacteria bacterium]
MLPVVISVITLISIAFPLLCSAWLWKGKFTSRTDWATRALLSAAVVVFFLVAGTWAFASVWLKYAIALLFAIAVVKTFPRLEDRTIFGRRDSRGRASYRPRIILLVIFLTLDFLAIKGRFIKDEPLDLSFPLKEGRYYVLQGGAGRIANPFHSSAADRYALDIVKLNMLGNRASGFFPSELYLHKIYGEVVYSPCSGSVAKVKDGLPDNPPRSPDTENPAGNHIVIECGDALVLMAHLLQGSITVKEKQSVKENQVIARVGNSGNSFEPHLHISATLKDEPEKALPLTFNERFLAMNRSFRN